MPCETLDIHPPLAGVSEALAYQHQEPYTCARAVNIWPRDQFENRRRPGSRPGLVKAFPTGVTGPVHLLANVRCIESDINIGSVAESFSSTTWPNHWTDGHFFYGFYGTLKSLIQIDGYAALSIPNNASPTQYYVGSRVLQHLQANVSAGIDYRVEFSILKPLRYIGGFWNEVSANASRAAYRLLLQMDNSNPILPSSGIEVRISYEATGGDYPSVEIYKWSGGTPILKGQANAGEVIGGYPRRVRATITVGGAGNDTCTVLVTPGMSSELSVATMGAASPVGSQRCGFGISGYHAGGEENRIRVDDFSVTYKGGTPIPNRNIIVMAGGTNAYSSKLDVKYEDTPNTFIRPNAHADTVVNPKARLLQAVELLGRLYILGEDVAAAGEPSSTLWCFHPKGSGAIGSIASVHGTAGFEFTPAPSVTVPPTDCTWIAAWRSRLVMGGKRTEPHNAFFSKAGEPQNWTEGSIPVGAACKLNTTGIDTGQLAEPANAGVAFNDDYFLFGCLKTLYVLRGDPTYGGQLDRLAEGIGIISPQAWASGPNGELIFRSVGGVYTLPAGALSQPQPVSPERLPRELRDTDVEAYRILMAYDRRNRGVFIGQTPILGSGGTYWWLDWQTKGFWKMEFDPAHEPTSLVFRNADSPLDQRLLFGCRDGSIRCFDDNAFDDDGVPRRTDLLLGPFMLARTGYYDGYVREVIGQTAIGSSDLFCELQVGNSIEGAYRASGRARNRLKGGKNRTFRPDLRGQAAFLHLFTTDRGAWAWENLTVAREQVGKQLA